TVRVAEHPGFRITAIWLAIEFINNALCAGRRIHLEHQTVLSEVNPIAGGSVKIAGRIKDQAGKRELTVILGFKAMQHGLFSAASVLKNSPPPSAPQRERAPAVPGCSVQISGRVFNQTAQIWTGPVRPRKIMQNGFLTGDG